MLDWWQNCMFRVALRIICQFYDNRDTAPFYAILGYDMTMLMRIQKC